MTEQVKEANENLDNANYNPLLGPAHSIFSLTTTIGKLSTNAHESTRKHNIDTQACSSTHAHPKKWHAMAPHADPSPVRILGMITLEECIEVLIGK